jgi:hypothetical protein
MAGEKASRVAMETQSTRVLRKFIFMLASSDCTQSTQTSEACLNLCSAVQGNLTW